MPTTGHEIDMGIYGSRPQPVETPEGVVQRRVREGSTQLYQGFRLTLSEDDQLTVELAAASNTEKEEDQEQEEADDDSRGSSQD